MMKKGLMVLLLAALAAPALYALELPAPDRSGGAPLGKALDNRHSARSFDPIPLRMEELGTLLWSAVGVNRADGRLTIPTARNVQDIEVYALTEEAAWRYDAKTHSLEQVLPGDHRALAGTQPFVKTAAVNLLYVSDLSKYNFGDDEAKLRYAHFHAGSAAQNVGLYCASVGFANVVRGYFNADEIRTALQLPENKQVIMTHSIGLPAEAAE